VPLLPRRLRRLALGHRHGALIEQIKQYPFSKRPQRFVRQRKKFVVLKNEFVASSRVSLAQGWFPSGHSLWREIRDNKFCYNESHLYSLIHTEIQRKNEEKARQPETKLGAIERKKSHSKATQRKAKPNQTPTTQPTDGARNRPIWVWSI
jgi:hypothetical protein